MTDRLLGGDAPPPAAGLARPHGQAQWRPTSTRVARGGCPGVAALQTIRCRFWFRRPPPWLSAAPGVTASTRPEI